MLRAASKILGVFMLILAGSAGVWVYQEKFAASAQIAKLEHEKKALQEVVQRLSDEKRVAEILVTDQKVDSSGEMRTNLLFVEYTRGGKSLPPKSFTIVGKWAHIDAMVIKFDHHFVQDGDTLRGQSLALFSRIFGDQQAAKDAPTIDEPGKVPEVFQDADPKSAAFEQDLWKDFWKLSSDEDYRAKMGVRVAMGESVWGMFEPDKLYRITLESDGGLNLTSEPLRGIYREALHQTH